MLRRFCFTHALGLYILTLIFFGPCFSKATSSDSSSYAHIKKLDLNLVARLAIQNSDSFKSLQAEELEAESLEESLGAQLDWTLLAQYRVERNRPDNINFFQPNESLIDSWNFGFKKSFLTGTTLETTYGSSFERYDFLTTLFDIPDYYQNTFNVRLTQDLWSNFFGHNTKSAYEALKSRSEAQKIQYLQSQDSWGIDLIEVYYNAWLTQTQYFAAVENSKRRQKLLQALRTRAQRGTSERQDVLQVEAAALQTENALSQAESQLNEVWRQLLVTLKLPEFFWQLQPSQISMELSSSPPETQSICTEKWDIEKTYSVAIAREQFEAAEDSLKGAESLLNPKLQLVGGYSTNGVDPSQRQAAAVTRNGDHPSWNVGLNFELPLGFSEARSQRAKAHAELIRARSALDTARSQKRIELLTLCDKLKRAQKEVANSKLAFSHQKQRLDLEEQRFRLGRTTTFNVVQAGDDKTLAEQNHNSSEVQYRMTAWKVLKASSQFQNYLQGWKSSP